MRAAAAALLLLLLLLLSSVAGLAQSSVRVVGPVTPGHCASFFSTTQIQDAGVCGSGGGGGTPGGSTSQLQYNNAGAFGGIAGATTDGTITTFGNNDLALLGSSTGATTFASANASASNFTLTLPATTDTVAVLGTPQTFTANLTFSGTINHTGPFQIGGNTMTFPATAQTLAGLGTPQTWTAVQTYTNSDIALLGSSTGKTTFTSANAGASNFTLTFPATTDTLAVLGTAQTFTAPQTFAITQTIASATAANWRNIYGAGATTTITGNTGSPITALYAAEIAQPTLTDASAVTVTNAGTFFIGGPPIAAGSVTITNAWAIRVGTGNVSFPGSANTLGTITSGTWNGSLIGLAFGGTNNALTASAGGIVWSDASKLNILAGTSTAGQCLLSGNLVTPSWATCPGGGGTPGGANTNVQFNSSGAFGGDTGFTYAGAGGVLTLTPAANTAQPFLITGGSTTGTGVGRLGLNVVGTLNTTGVVDGSVLFANILNTGSAVTSSLVDIQVSSSSVFAVSGGTTGLLIPGSIITSPSSGVMIRAGPSGPLIYNNTATDLMFGGGGSIYSVASVNSPTAVNFRVGSTAGIGWSSNSSPNNGAADTGLWRIAATVVAVGTATSLDATGAIEARSHVVTGATPTFTGTCTAPSAKSGGNTAGTWTVAAAGTCAAGTYILTFAFTAPNGWSCDAHDQTTPADAINQTASTTTTATFTATTANNDVVSYKCMAF